MRKIYNKIKRYIMDKLTMMLFKYAIHKELMDLEKAHTEQEIKHEYTEIAALLMVLAKKMQWNDLHVVAEQMAREKYEY